MGNEIIRFVKSIKITHFISMSFRRRYLILGTEFDLGDLFNYPHCLGVRCEYILPLVNGRWPDVILAVCPVLGVKVGHV